MIRKGSQFHKGSAENAGAAHNVSAVSLVGGGAGSGATRRWLADRHPALLVLGLLFFVMPLYRTGVLEDSFITPKVGLTYLLVFLAALALLGKPALRGASDRCGGAGVWVSGLFLLFACVNVASTGWALSWIMAVHGSVYLVVFLALHWLCSRVVRSWRDFQFLFCAGAASAVATAAWTLFEDTFPRADAGIVPLLADWRGFLAAGLGNSGHIAGFIGIFLPGLIFSFLLRRRLNWVMLAGIVICFGAQIVTWSVGSTGAFVVSFVIWFCVLLGSDRVRRAFHLGRLAGLFGTGVALAAFYLLPHGLNPHQPSLWAQAFHSQRWAEGWPTRIVIWKTTWHMICAHLWLGVGAGNFTLAYPQQIVAGVWADPALRAYAGAFTNDAHNEYMQIWAETGLPSLVIYLAMVVAFFWGIAARLRWVAGVAEKVMLVSAGAGVTVFLLDSLMSFPIRLPSHFAAFAFLLSVVWVPVRGFGSHRVKADHKELAGSGWTALRERLLAVLVLVVLAGGGYMVFRRVAAEYCLKAGRSAVEASTLVANGTYVSPWRLAEADYQNALVAVARGGAVAWKDPVSQMTKVAKSEAFDEARVWFRRGMEWDPWYANEGSRLGALLLYQGRFADSIMMNERTLATLDSYEIHERLGAAYFFLGNVKAAVREWDIVRRRYAPAKNFFDALVRAAGEL